MIVNLGIIELEEMEFRAFHGCYPLETNRRKSFLGERYDQSRPLASGCQR